MSDSSAKSPADTTAPRTGGRAQLILAVGVMLFAIGQSLLFIIVAPLSRAVGLSELEFGMAFTIANLPLMLTSPWWGRRSDIVGRKPIFITGLAGSALGTTLMAIVLGLALDGQLTGMLLIVVLIGKVLEHREEVANAVIGHSRLVTVGRSR